MKVGVDVGATLAKLALCAKGQEPVFHLQPAGALSRVAEQIEAAAPKSLGVTGGGSAELASLLGRPTAAINEFAAWGAGVNVLLQRAGIEDHERYLIVSVGTGTSAMLHDGLSVTRIGGTALGGGTIVGLATALIDTDDFHTVVELASRGSRRAVDLLVSDIYRSGETPLFSEITAVNFGRLARLSKAELGKLAPEDIAQGLMGLVGENVSLICSGLAAAAGVTRIVYAGSTLRDNPALHDVLDTTTRALGRKPTFLPNGEFAGALGALLLAG